MTTRIASMTRRPLAAALFVALIAPGMAFAQTAKERALEARVAELERQVQMLVSAQQQQQSQIATTQQQVTQVQATQAAQPAPLAAGKQPIQNTTIMTAANPGTAFSYGGFIKMDAMVTDTSDGRIADGSSGRLFYVPSTIPVAGAGADGGDPYADFHAQFSRFWLSADHVTEGGDKFKAYIEADFFGGGNNTLVGNETSTNTYAVSLRQAYVTWNNWLAGQAWSNFMDTAALPDAVDFVGPTDGTIFVRQAQLRYTKGPWSFSVENPQTTVTPYLTGTRFNSGDNVAPDVTARWQTKGDWGHFSVAGLLRQFKLADETDTGAAVSVSGKFNLGKSDDIRYAVNAGQGIGRGNLLGGVSRREIGSQLFDAGIRGQHGHRNRNHTHANHQPGNDETKQGTARVAQIDRRAFLPQQPEVQHQESKQGENQYRAEVHHGTVTCTERHDAEKDQCNHGNPSGQAVDTIRHVDRIDDAHRGQHRERHRHHDRRREAAPAGVDRPGLVSPR